MRNTRRGILSLMAAGRITPSEAERLLAAWNAGREWMWAAFACAALGLAQCVASHGVTLPGHGVWAELPRALHSAISGVVNRLGGGL